MSNGKPTKKTQPANANGSNKPRIGLALGGGGPIGGIYEIGALRALDEALEGLDFNDLDVYVGVNSGSFVAAHLVNPGNHGSAVSNFCAQRIRIAPVSSRCFLPSGVR